MNLPERLRVLFGGTRRRGWRKDVHIPARVVLPSGSTMPVEITEASPSGFRMRSPRRFPRGRVVALLLPTPPPGPEVLEVPIEIRWNRKVQSVGGFRYRCGGQFCSMPDDVRRMMAEYLLVTPGFELREIVEKRHHARLVQNARVGGEQMVVRDVSASGVGLLSKTLFEVGDTVEIVLNLGGAIPCRGEVLWSRPTSNPKIFHVGVKFLDLDERLRQDLVLSIDEMIRQARLGTDEED